MKMLGESSAASQTVSTSDYIRINLYFDATFSEFQILVSVSPILTDCSNSFPFAQCKVKGKFRESFNIFKIFIYSSLGK